MAYIRCPVRPYIPNLLRCFQCQRYGHSKNVCRGQPTCPRCGESGHDSADCKKKEQCLNCKGEHPAYSRSCPTWIIEKEITSVKNKRQKFPTQRHGVLFCHARRSLVRVMLVPTARAHRISVSNVTLKKKDNSSVSSTPTEPELVEYVVNARENLDPVCVFNHIVNYRSKLWRKVKAANGLYRDFNIPILKTSTALYSSPLDVANLIGKTFASVSSSDSYAPHSRRLRIAFRADTYQLQVPTTLPYNCDFDMFELKRALSSAHNTSPGPDGISYVLLRHLSVDSLASLYVDDLQISCEGSDMRMIERQLQTAVNNIVKCKSTVAPVVFERVFAYHRSQYSRYSAIYTDGSKRADYVGCGVVIEDIMHGYRLDTSCSISLPKLSPSTVHFN
ncbi:putative RNA-directed DNA polymerase from transposon X-element [Trichonephila clavipes]|nr:putative RNA-directed DNA polymerase from transposon X-element [Trichonephila clavipes]